jgi:hypothetical protein
MDERMRLMLRGVMATVLVLALVGMLLSLLVPGVAQAWEQIGVPIGSPCPDVLVIGARGSGEAPQANGGVNPIDYESDPHHGMGDVT